MRFFLSFSKCVVLALLFAKWGLRRWGKHESQGEGLSLISVSQGCLWGPKDTNLFRLFKGLFTVCMLTSTVALGAPRVSLSSRVSWQRWPCTTLTRHKRLRGVRWSGARPLAQGWFDSLCSPGQLASPACLNSSSYQSRLVVIVYVVNLGILTN